MSVGEVLAMERWGGALGTEGGIERTHRSLDIFTLCTYLSFSPSKHKHLLTLRVQQLIHVVNWNQRQNHLWKNVIVSEEGAISPFVSLSVTHEWPGKQNMAYSFTVAADTVMPKWWESFSPNTAKKTDYLQGSLQGGPRLTWEHIRFTRTYKVEAYQTWICTHFRWGLRTFSDTIQSLGPYPNLKT